MLTSVYIPRTQQLLQNPSAPSTLYSVPDLTTYINQARGQVAAESESIRILGALTTVANQRSYNFSGINTGVSATTGVQGVIHVRAIRFAIASGFQFIAPRSWEWFDFYHMCNPVPVASQPAIWAQYGQGSSAQVGAPTSGSSGSGSFFLDPPPDGPYALTLDCVCYPNDLVLDTDVEAIPYLWTDAVAYFAAYLACLAAQTGARQADANRHFERYTEFVARARRFSNPAVNRYLYSQAQDPTQAAKIGLKPASGQ